MTPGADVRYRFEKTVKVAGVVRREGEVVPAADIPAGSLGSLLRMRQVSAVADDPPAPAVPDAPAPEPPAPAAPAKRHKKRK